MNDLLLGIIPAMLILLFLAFVSDQDKDILTKLIYVFGIVSVVVVIVYGILTFGIKVGM